MGNSLSHIIGILFFAGFLTFQTKMYFICILKCPSDLYMVHIDENVTPSERDNITVRFLKHTRSCANHYIYSVLVAQLVFREFDFQLEPRTTYRMQN